MSKVLGVLAVVQIVALSLLAVEIVGLQEQVAQVDTAAPAPPPVAAAAPVPPRPAAAPAQAALPDELWIEVVRQVVREEIEYAVAGLSAPAGPAEPVANQLSEEESLERFYYTTQRIDAFAQRGRMSEMEMSNLQQQIATLNPEHRTEALKHLVRAMNSGQLDARL